MQIVIEIPEEIYNELKMHPLFLSDMPAVERAIKNGTLLPKGHGDLYDYNDLSKLVDEDFRIFLSRLDLKSPQPVIPAEKEG